MTDEHPKICFIDAATQYGVAVGRAGQVPQSWTGRFAKPSSSHGAIAAGAMKMMTGLVTQHRPDSIIIEAPLPVTLVNGKTNVSTTEILMGLPFVLQGMAYTLGVYDLTVARVSKIREHFIGKNMKGEKAKPIVWQKCIDLGWVGPDDDDLSFDRTDALAGWSFAEHQLAPKIAQPVDDLYVAAEKRKRLAAQAAAATRQSCLIPETF